VLWIPDIGLHQNLVALVLIFNCQGSCNQLMDMLNGILNGHQQHLSGIPDLDLHLPFGQALAADYYAKRYADQVIVFEFDARPLVAVVKEYFQTHLFELEIYLFSFGHNTLILGVESQMIPFSS